MRLPSGLTVIVIENKDEEAFKRHIDDRGFKYYEIERFFDPEGFTTLEEVEAWWESK